MKHFNDNYCLLILELKNDMKIKKIKVKKISKELGVCYNTLYRYLNFQRAMPLDIYLTIKEKVKESE